MALLRILLWIATLSLLCIVSILVLLISGHRLRVSNFKFRLPLSISLYGLSYFYSDTVSLSSSHLKISLKLPKIPHMTFITTIIYDYDYIDPQHHVAVTKIYVEARLLPVAPETFINVVLHDFKVRIIQSQNTPSWLQIMRQNLIRTVLNGEYLRLDDFKTQITLCTRGTVPNTPARESVNLVDGKAREISTNSDQSVATLKASEWHIKGAQQRLYHFGSVDAQFRYSWDSTCDKEVFALVAQNSSWVLAPHPFDISTREDCAQQTPSCFSNKLLFVLKAFLAFPLAFFKTIYDPPSALTLHSSRLDVTFDQFRLRDAELVRQSWEYLWRQYELLKDRKGMNMEGFVQDMLMAGI
ncbi:hypothetical protein E4T56_gene21017 [Termitomyces sp. T112]|nr:hypothetical protein E4T56_gene21017 [Termitomyces sp. T112]